MFNTVKIQTRCAHTPLAILCLGLCSLLSVANAAAPPAGYVRIEQDASSVAVTGTGNDKWHAVTSSSYSGGTALQSDKPGAQLTLSFSGTAVQWIGFMGPSGGLADVYLDDKLIANADSYAATDTPQAMIYGLSGLSPAAHTLRIVADGKHDPAASGSFVWVDAFDVLPLPTDNVPPTVSMTAPASGATVSGTITVSANASDNVGVVGVQFELDGAALGSEVTTAPYSISWNTTTTSNGSHILTAVARDGSGNSATSAPATVTVANNSVSGTPTRIEQNNPAVTYTGTWISPSDPSLSGGSAAESNTAGSTATLTFTGTAVTWISYTCPCSAGIAEVSLDGGPATQVDTFSATPTAQVPVFAANKLPEGSHTLKITVTGTMDPAGTTAYVLVDAFDVTP